MYHWLVDIGLCCRTKNHWFPDEVGKSKIATGTAYTRRHKSVDITTYNQCLDGDHTTGYFTR